MKGKVRAPMMISAAVALGGGVISSIAPAEDLSRSTRSRLDGSRLTYARLYCTPDNESHFGELTAALTKQNFAPPAARSTLGAISRRQACSSQASRRTGALPTWRTISIIPLPRFSCLPWSRVYSRSQRQMERRDGYMPVMWSS